MANNINEYHCYFHGYISPSYNNGQLVCNNWLASTENVPLDRLYDCRDFFTDKKIHQINYHILKYQCLELVKLVNLH